MIDELEDLLPGFSKANHTHCFLHVNNLVARTLVRQFDILHAPKPRDTPDHELHELAGDIDIEDRQTRETLLEDAVTGEIGIDDNVDGWVDEMAALSQAEREILQASLRPVKMLLVKVNMRVRMLTMSTRSENLHSKPSTRQQFCFQHGLAVLKNWIWNSN